MAWRLTWRATAAVAVIGALSGGTLVLFNSGAWPQRSPADRSRQFNDAFARSTAWMIAHPDWSNSALVQMTSEMAALSGDTGLRAIRQRFFTDSTMDTLTLWRRVVDPNWKPVQAAIRFELDMMQEYQRWVLYGAAPDSVPLNAEERADMFSPDKYWWGKRTHQLYALLLYRRGRPETPGLVALIDGLAAGVAAEQRWDFRVTDLFIQRIAFVLAAGRPDLVQRRWVDRMLDNQQPDGGWSAPWHGLGPGAFEVTFAGPSSNSHTTVQAAWVLYMLKYKYPTWYALQ